MTEARQALAAAADAFGAAGVDTPRLDAELLLAEALGVPRERLYTKPEQTVEGQGARAFAEFVRRRVRREPVAYILGRAYFRRLTLHVDCRVLIPRPETELLVELAGEALAGERAAGRGRVLDVGTGSGAVALAIADEYRDAAVTATDSSPDALVVARANAVRLGLGVEFVEADLVSGSDHDVIVSNPPYVREDEWRTLQQEIVGYEPRAALVAGPDGLEVIGRLVPAAHEDLRSGGLLGVEVGIGQAGAVAELAREAGFGRVGTKQDLAGIERVVWARR